MTLSTIIIISILFVIQAIADAVVDTLSHHMSTSVFKGLLNNHWWDPKISFKNKYRYGHKDEGPRFLGSTTFLVFITDAWHMFKFIRKTSIELAVTILIGLNWWQCIIGVLLIKIIVGLVFELFYGKILRK